MSQPLIFTDNAAAKVRELMEEEGNFNLKLRVYVTGGGCSGFRYGFTFDEAMNPDDTVVETTPHYFSDLFIVLFEKMTKEFFLLYLLYKILESEEGSGGEGKSARAVKLLIDPMSFQYLTGSEIDYQEDLEGAQFIIRNPNAKTTCGCGSSFSA